MTIQQPLIKDEYRYCQRCGTKNGQVGVSPFRCQECGFSHYFGPVAAVGALIVNEQNQLLMVRRVQNPGQGLWGLPGGFVDPDESAEQALAREIAEETKLVMESCTLLITGPNRYCHSGISACVLDLFFACTIQWPAKIVLAEDELDRYEWTRPDSKRLGEMAFASNRRAVEHWLDLN